MQWLMLADTKDQQLYLHSSLEKERKSNSQNKIYQDAATKLQRRDKSHENKRSDGENTLSLVGAML